MYFRLGRQVQVEDEPTLALSLAVARGPAAFRNSCDGAVGGAASAVVVAALVSSQGLPRREALVADAALVGPPTRGHAGRNSRDSLNFSLDGGGGGGGIRLAVTGLVAAECLVRTESLVADDAPVRSRGMRRQVSRRGGGGSGVGGVGGAASEQHEAESYVLILGKRVLPTWPLGPLPRGPRLAVVVVHVAVGFLFEAEIRSGVGGIQSLQGHFGLRECAVKIVMGFGFVRWNGLEEAVGLYRG